MLIEEIKFVDFGPFHGEHKLTFANGGKGVHIIHGENGQGKTSILRGILWGLYGKVKDRVGQEIRPTSLLNRTAKKDGVYRFGVVIKFTHDGESWTLTRKMESKAFSDRAFEGRMYLTLVKDGEVISNPEQAICRLLPDDVSRFFFFDGEMLQDYEELLDQSSHAMAVLRDSIEHVLGIPYLKVGRDDLTEVKRKLENERGRLVRRLGGATYEELADLFQAISKKIADDEQKVKEIDTAISKLDVQITDKKRKLSQISEVRELAEEQLKLDREVELLEAKKKAQSERVLVLLRDLYKTVIARSAEDIIDKLHKKDQAAMAKYNEKQQLLGIVHQIEQGIQGSKCNLCGTVLDARKLRSLKSDQKGVQEKIKKLTEIPEPNREFDDHVNRLEALREKMIYAKDFSETTSIIASANHEIAVKNARLAEVKEKLGGTDTDEPRKIASEIEEDSSEKGRLNALKKTMDAQRTEDLEAKSNIDQKLKGIDQGEINELAERIDLVTAAFEIFEQAIAVYRDKRRQDVGKLASDIFKQLRTKASFSHLDINPQFGLNIITTDGQVLDRPEWRSSGEEQVVALALIGALNKSAQVSAAIFMDTPFARLDTKHGERVLKYIPKMSEQIVLFVTDREFGRGDARLLNGHIKSEFTVTHRSEEDGSTISASRT